VTTYLTKTDFRFVSVSSQQHLSPDTYKTRETNVCVVAKC